MNAFLFAASILTIWDQPRTVIKPNTQVEALFSVNERSQTAVVKVNAKTTTYVSPRNLPVIKKKTWTVPVDGLFLNGDELMYDNVLCGKLRTSAGPGPRSNWFSRKLILNGNCGLKVVKYTDADKKGVRIDFYTK